MTSIPAAALHRLATVDRRRAALAAAGAIAALSVPAVVAYPGTAWRGLLFCAVSGGLAPLALALGQSPFRMLIGVFLALGFWAKFVVHFAIGEELVEPLGVFPAHPPPGTRRSPWQPQAWLASGPRCSACRD